MSSQQNQIENTIHPPNIEFHNWCSERFSINRGLYNVIDLVFFNGIKNMINRRTAIVQFLTYLQTKDPFSASSQPLEVTSQSTQKGKEHLSVRLVL